MNKKRLRLALDRHDSLFAELQRLTAESNKLEIASRHWDDKTPDDRMDSAIRHHDRITARADKLSAKWRTIGALPEVHDAILKREARS